VKTFIAALALAALCVGCSKEDPTTTPTPPTDTATPTATTTPSPDEVATAKEADDLAKEIEADLADEG
jgi:hypothetical protein